MGTLKDLLSAVETAGIFAQTHCQKHQELLDMLSAKELAEAIINDEAFFGDDAVIGEEPRLRMGGLTTNSNEGGPMITTWISGRPEVYSFGTLLEICNEYPDLIAHPGLAEGLRMSRIHGGTFAHELLEAMIVIIEQQWQRRSNYRYMMYRRK